MESRAALMLQASVGAAQVRVANRLQDSLHVAHWIHIALQVREGFVPNEHGTWQYGRNGWCDGAEVPRAPWPSPLHLAAAHLWPSLSKCMHSPVIARERRSAVLLV